MNRSYFAYVFRNLNFLTLEKIVNLTLGIVVSIYLTRYLGPENYGMLNYGIILVGIISAFSRLGLNQIAIREFVKNEKPQTQILLTSIVFKFCASLISFIIIILIALTEANSISKYIILITGVVILFQPFEVFDFLFQARLQVKYSIFSRLAPFVFFNLIKLIMVLSNSSIFAIAMMFTLESLVYILILYIIFKKKYKEQLKLNFAILDINLLKSAFPLLLAGICTAIYMQLDQILVKFFLDYEYLGYYSLTVKITSLFYFVPTILASTIFPIQINYKQTSIEQYNRVNKLLFTAVIGIATYSSILVAIFSEYIVLTLFSASFIQTSRYLPYYFWVTILVAISIVVSNILVAENMQKYAMIFGIIGAISNIFLNIIFIQMFGIFGAIAASFLSYIISTYLILRLFRKTKFLFKLINTSVLSLFRFSTYNELLQLLFMIISRRNEKNS